MTEPVRSLDRISIPKPCDADWEAMIGNDQVRFCTHCKLQVTNLSSMNRREAMLLVARAEGRLCVRFVQAPGGDVLTREVPERLHQIVRRASRIAAGAFTASLSLSTAAAQSVPPKAADETAVMAAKPNSEGNSSMVSGVVLDPNGAVIAGAKVALLNTITGAEITTTSSDDGSYKFTGVARGSYKIRIEAAGFKNLELIDIELEKNSTRHLESAMEVASLTVTMGVVAIVEPADPLIKAAYKDDMQTLVTLIPLARDINKSDKDTGETALSYAVSNNNPEMVSVLLSAGANINNVEERGRTALMYLNDKATVGFVRSLISLGPDVNARDESGETVLMAAATSCSLDVFKELVSVGAKIAGQDTSGNTILMRAVENDNPAIVKYLIAAGVSINARNDDGDTALRNAARYGRGDALKALIEGGAAIDLSQKELNEALVMAARNVDPSTVRILLQAGADPNTRDSGQTTVLMIVAECGKPEALRALIDAGAELNAVDENGWTALMHADEVENIRTLVDAGADPDRKNNDGETVLALAIRYNQPDVVRFLQSRGAPD
jgi:ankyrin repeat protein